MANDANDVREALDRLFSAEPSVRLSRTDLEGRVGRLKRRRLATAPAGVALALAAAFVGVGVVNAERQSLAQPLSMPVRAGLAEKARDALEDGVASTVPRGACAVRVLGTDPVHVRDVGDARTVYVWAHCASIGGDVRTEASLPVAVHLTVPPTAEVPRDGPLSPMDRERIFPRRLWEAVRDGSQYTELEPQLRQRIRDRS